MSTPETNRYLAPSEVAHLLNVSKASVYRAVESGDLPHVQLRPNGAVRIPADALEARSQKR
jgi:excisionase family DNA binding protein